MSGPRRAGRLADGLPNACPRPTAGTVFHMKMSGTSEQRRGINDAGQQLTVLREKWPAAFPVLAHDVRPLALGVAGEIAAAMGWSLRYTHGVLKHWRRTPAYCRAVLLHNERISLDGSPAESIDVEAKKLATKQLAKLAAKKAPAVTKPPTKTPSPLHDRVRASLGRRG
jgi:sRNA-binding protein